MFGRYSGYGRIKGRIGGGKGIQASGPAFKEDSRTPCAPLRFFGARLHRPRWLFPRMMPSSSRYPEVFSLVEPREETWDGTAEKDALVTGSTDGVGRLVARKLGQAGAHVLVHGRDAERGARVLGDTEASGGAADFLAADLSALAEVRRFLLEKIP